jgi:hypothetical protein
MISMVMVWSWSSALSTRTRGVRQFRQVFRLSEDAIDRVQLRRTASISGILVMLSLCHCLPPFRQIGQAAKGEVGLPSLAETLEVGSWRNSESSTFRLSKWRQAVLRTSSQSLPAMAMPSRIAVMSLMTRGVLTAAAQNRPSR